MTEPTPVSKAFDEMLRKDLEYSRPWDSQECRVFAGGPLLSKPFRIAVVGIQGSGKTRVSRMLAEAFNAVHFLCEPGGKPSLYGSDVYKNYILDAMDLTEVTPFFAPDVILHLSAIPESCVPMGIPTVDGLRTLCLQEQTLLAQIENLTQQEYPMRHARPRFQKPAPKVIRIDTNKYPVGKPMTTVHILTALIAVMPSLAQNIATPATQGV